MKSIQVPRRFTRKAWGGTETVVMETSKRLLASGHDTSVLTSAALDPISKESIEGVEVHRLPYFYPYWGLSLAATAQMDRKGGNLFSTHIFGQLLREPGVDLLHVHTGKRLGGIVRTAARLRGIPYVVSLHGGAYDVPSGETSSWTAPTDGAIEWGRALGFMVGSRRVLDDAAAVVCLGHKERTLVEKNHPGVRAVILPNGVDPSRFERGDGLGMRAHLRLQPDDELILVPARIDAQKNQALAIDILSALAHARPTLHVAFMGPVTSPVYLKELKDKAHREGVVDRIRFFETGPGSTDLADAYAAADIVLVPSVHEPFGIVVLEAWASRRPVIASRVGGLIDLVSGGRDGALISPDNLREWVATTSKFLDDRELGRSLAACGYEKAVRDYTWDSVTKRLIDLYADVTHQGAARLPRRVASVTARATDAA